MKMRYFTPLIAAAVVFAAPAYAETTVQSAQKLIEDYYSAINAHNYKAAFEVWEKGENGKIATGQNYKNFAHGFNKTSNVSVKILNIEPIDAGMGHVFTTVNVQITATDNKGRSQNFGGFYNLRALNDTLAATDWKIMTSKIRKY